MNNIERINEDNLKILISTGSVRQFNLIAQNSGGFIFTCEIGLCHKTLFSQRGYARVFKNLDRAVSYLRKLSIGKLTIDLTDLSTHKRPKLAKNTIKG